MGMNSGASEPRAPTPNSLPDCISTERHLLFLPELPQVAHSNPSPVALKTSLMDKYPVSIPWKFSVPQHWMHQIVLQSRSLAYFS